MVTRLSGAVGRPSAEGNLADNQAIDQQMVIELLDAGWHPPLIPLVEQLPPVEEGVANEALCVEIARFQQANNLIVVDGRVSVGGQTWQMLVFHAQATLQDPQPPPVVLSLSDFEVRDLPRIASGLPSVTYSIDGTPCILYGPGYTMELKTTGSLKVDWGNALPFAVAVSPTTASLQTKVDNGVVQSTPAVKLAEDSAEMQQESRVAIGTLFAAVTVGMGVNGAPVLGGSIGNAEGFLSVSWDPLARAIVYRGERQVFTTVVTRFGGVVTITGRLRVELKVTSGLVADEASVVAALAVAVALGYVVIPPVLAIEGGGALLAIIGRGLMKLVPRVLLYAHP